MKKTLGHVKNAEFSLEEPINVKIGSMNFNSLTLLVGTNGTGKTLLNKVIYFATFYAALEFALKDNVAHLKEHVSELEKYNPQFLFDHIFEDPKEFTGNITVHFENGSFYCNVKEGIISNARLEYDSYVNASSFPRYLSSTARLFTNVETILKAFKIDNDQVLEEYKLYDVMHAKYLEKYALLTSNFSDNLIKTFKESYEFDCVKLTYDEASHKFYYTDSKGVTRKVTSLGAGHQAIINMFVGAS